MFRNQQGRELTTLSVISFLELPKVRKACQGKESLNGSERWSLFLSARDGEVMEMLKKQSAEMNEAVEKWRYVSEDEKLRFLAEMREKAEMDHLSGMAGAREEGWEAGLAEGMEKGREKGLVEGVRETARRMKADGVEEELIIRFTGLTPEEVKAL
ncbi:MAG: Rpn family recombination-promoting nuclease/putative transposase [Bacillota bacterium]|nr:Rpn family recombination-promoting nuclease/putative transposase [Bacillota bacterium]